MKRRAFLDEAARLVEEAGLDALTIKALAGRVGCSVGALYRHFQSKESLIAAMQGEAIRTLIDAYDDTQPALDELLAPLTSEAAALGRLVGFGAMVAAAGDILPAEFGLQQRLLSTPQLAVDPSEAAAVVPLATSMMLRPAALIDAAEAGGWLDPAPSFPRAVRWVAALGGVLQLRRIDHPDAPMIDVDGLARDLSLELLLGWGAERAALTEAAEVVSTSIARQLLSDAVAPRRAS